MTPSVPDRLASAVRALTYVILPALPTEASLAREQVQLVIGHLQIIIAQYDTTAQFEEHEAGSFVALARSVAEIASGGRATGAARDALIESMAGLKDLTPLKRTKEAQDLLDDLLQAMVVDGDGAANARIRKLILEHGGERSDLDRRWFAMMGFDPEMTQRMAGEC